MNWKKLDCNDKEIIDEYTKNRFITCDYNFTNQLLWSVGENTAYKIEDNILILKGTYNQQDYYYMPVPLNEQDETLSNWKKIICNILKENKKITLVPEYWKEKLENDFILEEKRDTFDYVYNSYDLAYLKGRKYSKKKNRINNFKKSYNYEYEKIDKSNIEEVIEFQNNWYRDNKGPEVLKNEHLGILTLLKNFSKLDICGGLIRIHGEIIAYSLGEILSPDYAVIHIEKALNDYIGSYQAINHLFVETEFENVKFINREDDFGDPGLREAKESYHPAMLLKKYEIIGSI